MVGRMDCTTGRPMEMLGDKETIHHIHMEVVRRADLPDIPLKISKISGEDGGEKF